MHIDSDAPGNISQKGVNSEADNETGFDKHAPDVDSADKELGFDPDSPDLSDPTIDPPHPARTSNDPVPSGDRTNQKVD